MTPKTDKSMSVAEITSLSRSAAAALVEREEHNSGSRTAAYEIVAAMVGMSPSWLRQFIANRPGVKLSLPAALNIRQQYGRLCSRIEADAAVKRSRAMALRMEIDAAHQSGLGVVASKETGTTDAQNSPGIVSDKTDDTDQL